MKFSKKEKAFITLSTVTLLVCLLINITGAYTLDFVTSIIPGWHTTIIPFHIILIFLILLCLFFYFVIKIIRYFYSKEK